MSVSGTPLPASPVPCIRCGYDLRGSVAESQGICPECGKPIPPAYADHAVREIDQMIDRAARNVLGIGAAIMLYVCAAALLVRGALRFATGTAAWIGAGIIIIACVATIPLECRRLRSVLGARVGYGRAVVLAALIGMGSFAVFACGILATFVGGMVLIYFVRPDWGAPPAGFAAYFVVLALGLPMTYLGPRIGLRIARKLMRTSIVGAVAADTRALRQATSETDAANGRQ